MVSLVSLLTLMPSLSTRLAVPILSLHLASLMSLSDMPSLGTVTSVSLGFPWCYWCPHCAQSHEPPPGFLIVPSVPTGIWGHRGCWRAQ